MAAVVKHSSGVSLSSLEPPAGHRIVGQAGVAIAAGDACYIASDGYIKLADADSDNAAAIVRGFALRAVPAFGDVTLLCGGERLNYAEGTLTPGANLYLSTTAGQLDTAPQLDGDLPLAFAIDSSRIQLLPFRTETIALIREGIA